MQVHTYIHIIFLFYILVTRFCLLFFHCVLVYIFGAVYLATRRIHASIHCCDFSYNSKNTNLYCDLRKSHRRSSQPFSSLLLFLLPTRPSGPQRQPLGHFWKFRVSFIISPSTAALSHWDNTFAGTSCDTCRAEGNDKCDCSKHVLYFVTTSLV